MKHLYTSIMDCTTQAAATPSACALKVVLATQYVYCGVDIPLVAFLFADFEASLRSFHAVLCET
uniref:Uncharacterized protein n=1 Tax=Arundo donax TaxID=35708 RepID=A0A0A9DZA1_ARUDO